MDVLCGDGLAAPAREVNEKFSRARRNIYSWFRNVHECSTAICTERRPRAKLELPPRCDLSMPHVATLCDDLSLMPHVSGPRPARAETLPNIPRLHENERHSCAG